MSHLWDSANTRSEADHGAHLLGSARLFDLIFGSATASSLGEAARWIVLRQDIYFSLTKSQPLHMDLNHYDYPLTDSYMHSTEADSYTNRAVLLFARVLNYVFGSSEKADTSQWDNLNDEITAWYSGMPPDFFPLWYDPPNLEAGSAFPRIFMAQPIHSGFSHKSVRFARLTKRICSHCLPALLPVLARTGDI